MPPKAVMLFLEYIEIINSPVKNMNRVPKSLDWNRRLRVSIRLRTSLVRKYYIFPISLMLVSVHRPVSLEAQTPGYISQKSWSSPVIGNCDHYCLHASDWFRCAQNSHSRATEYIGSLVHPRRFVLLASHLNQYAGSESKDDSKNCDDKCGKSSDGLVISVGKIDEPQNRAPSPDDEGPLEGLALILFLLMIIGVRIHFVFFYDIGDSNIYRQDGRKADD